jgi:hypothetical protein
MLLMATFLSFCLVSSTQELIVTTPEVTPVEIAAFGGVEIQFDKKALKRIPPKGTVEIHDFPLGMDGNVELQLKRFDVFAEDAEYVVSSIDSLGFVNNEQVEKPKVVLLQGGIVGDPSSRVFLAIGTRVTNGLIQSNGRTYVIAKDNTQGWTAVYNLNDVEPEDMNWADFVCSVEDTIETVENKKQQQQHYFGGDCQELQMAIETDWEFNGTLFGGDEVASSEYAITLFGAVSSIYQSDVNVGISVVYLRIWEDSADPWTGGGTGSQLEQFRDYWNANMSGVSRHLAHFLSGRPLGGGVAWLNAVCTNYGYAVSANLAGSFPLPLVDHDYNNWDPFVVAHELGHNCGTSHTHNYDPPIDGCGLGDCSDAWGGTIMSYCHTCSGGMSNIVLSLHPIVQLTMENYLTNGISCALSCDPSTIGPCCIDVECVNISEDNCVLLEGTYFGDGNTCESTKCVPKLYIEYPDGHPSTINPYGGTSVAINITQGTSKPAPDSGNLHWKSSETDWEEISFVAATDSDYTVTFPYQSCGDTVDWFISFDTVDGDVVESPMNAPEVTWQTPVFSGIETVFYDDFQSNMGWLAISGAETGNWQRAVPSGNGDFCEPATAVGGSGMCFLTGNNYHEDVDNGLTMLFSPSISIDMSKDPVLSYYRWYSNGTNCNGANAYEDMMLVDLTLDNGNTFTSLEVVGPDGEDTEGGWRYVEFDLQDYLSETGVIDLRVLYTVGDEMNPSVVEAGVDNVKFTATYCGDPSPCFLADIDKDGSVGVSDLLMVIDEWGTDGDADVNGDGIVDVGDLLAIVDAWGPCA